MKKYNIIYADPAWHFSSKQLQKVAGKRFNSLDNEYINSNSKEFEKWDIEYFLDKDAACFMWTTDAHIPNAISLLNSWGFKYTTVAFIWSKKTNTGKQVATLGAWTMKNCELCFLGTRGKMLKYKKANNVYQLIDAERTTHSKKPDIFAEKIVEIFGNLPRIELFARDKKLGWDVYGNEILSDIEMKYKD
jgi:N6-adenosine-specific RNA methylase IME4